MRTLSYSIHMIFEDNLLNLLPFLISLRELNLYVLELYSTVVKHLHKLILIKFVDSLGCDM